MAKKQTMYLETSVISAYFDFWKRNPAQKRETRLLWNVMPQHFDVYISDIVMIEIDNTKHVEWKHQLQQLVRSIEKLTVTDEVQVLSQQYTSSNVIPQLKVNDALHLATAVVNNMDYLATWNFEHLSRPHQKRKILEFNQAHELNTPIIIEPSELVKEL